MVFSKNVKKDCLLYYVFAFFFIIIATFRGATRDTPIYKYVYDNIYSLTSSISDFYDKTGMEASYGILALLFNSLGLPFSFFLFFISFLTFYFIKKASNNFNVTSVYVLICYIPVFFANHQLMQIRQGLAIAIGYYFLSAILANKNKFFAYFSFIFGFFFHNIILIFVLFSNSFLNKIIATTRFKLLIKVLFIFIFIFIFCRVVTNLDLLSTTERISNYSDTEYSEERSFLHPANLRSIILLIIFTFLKPKKESFFYGFLVIFYAAGVGFRLGFYDFLILSGRLSTIFTFSEIFLIPMLLAYRFSKQTSFLILFIYFIVNLYINLVYQVPFILDDYFKPLW